MKRLRISIALNAASLLALALLSASVQGASPAMTIVCFGDSITAGYGLDANKSYPAALERLLSDHGYHYRVLNQGVSGNTTKDAVARVNAIVGLHPEVAVVEFGGNDGLRGLPPDITRQNLDSVITTLQSAHIHVLLVGITLPQNYGADYIKSFDSIFHNLAAKHKVPLKPMLYDHIYTVPDTIQPDGIHPTAKGSELIAENLLALLRPLLHK